MLPLVAPLLYSEKRPWGGRGFKINYIPNVKDLQCEKYICLGAGMLKFLSRGGESNWNGICGDVVWGTSWGHSAETSRSQ